MIDALRAEFLRLLTTDSPHHDRRRRDFNQALFMADGHPVWSETTLDMVMAKFDQAIKNTGANDPAVVLHDLDWARRTS